MTHAIDPAIIERAAEAMAPIWGLINLYEGMSDGRTVFVPLGMLRRARAALASAIPEAGEQERDALRSRDATRELLLKEAQANCDGLEEERDAALSELARLRTACAKENDEISQILGKALGYPWYKDDQEHFPGVTEADGVFVGEHVAITLVEEAAKALAKLRSEAE